MRAAANTKIFGIRLGLDPKVLILGLLALAGLLYWMNSGSGEESGSSSGGTRPQATAVTSPELRTKAAIRRSAAARNDRGVLKYVSVDGSRGDVDPTLHLSLLSRLQSVKLNPNVRNLFELGPATPQTGAAMTAIPKTIVPVVNPLSNPSMNKSSINVAVNIPLKYYGFVKPVGRTASNEGFFLDGDDVLIASEGELVKQRYLVVALNPNSARMEDTQLKQGQTLPVVPEAVTQ